MRRALLALTVLLLTALMPASETTALPRRSNAKPYGVAPADGFGTARPTYPPRTAKVSIV